MINVEVGDMPKEQVKSHLQGIKQMVEQKSALNTGNSMSEYTNPGPVENNVYVPTHGGIGAISTTQIGGDVDPKQLTDLSYFQDKFFGSMRVPKQFFGITDDAAGFNGGSSLAILSSRYGKAIKRIQNTLIQCITDAVNLYLIDAGLGSYINKFELRMQAPVTQEEIDRRENVSNRIRVVGDIMGNLNDLPNQVIKLKILKALLATVVTDNEVLGLIQEQIDKLVEEEANENKTPKTDKDNSSDENISDSIPSETGGEDYTDDTLSDFEDELFGNDESEETPEENIDANIPVSSLKSSEESGGEESYLPSFSELGIDGTNNSEQL